MDRSHLAAEQAAREEERLHEECTFTPDLPTKRAVAAAAAAAAAGEMGRDIRVPPGGGGSLRPAIVLLRLSTSDAQPNVSPVNTVRLKLCYPLLDFLVSCTGENSYH